VALLLLGDEELRLGLAKIALKIIDFFARIGEEIGKLLWRNAFGKPITWKDFKGRSLIAPDFLKTFDKAAAELAREGQLSSGLVRSAIPFKTGGIMPHTGLAYLHAGETVIPANRSGGVILNVTYNVTVSDKREFEEMLDRNNRQLLNETRRIVKV